MDVGAIRTAAAASAAPYGSFADATRSVLDLLERVMPDCALYLAHLDRQHGVHRIVDARGGERLGLRSDLTTPMRESYDLAMIEDRGARIVNDLAADAVCRMLDMQRRFGAGSYLGVPLELPGRGRVGSLSALAAGTGRFRGDDERLFTMLARVLAYELERESSERDLRRLDDSLRAHARGLGAVSRVVRVLGGGGDARRAVCRAARDMTGAPIGLLLEPSGRELAATAISGIDIAPASIRLRSDAASRALAARERCFVADARAHPAFPAELVDATGARSALLEPVLREGRLVGALTIFWRRPIEALPDAAAAMLRLLAAQAAVAIEQALLRARVEALALTDPLTGVAAPRVLGVELRRELARARRDDAALALALVDLDHLAAFNLLHGERAGDLLIKEAAARWRAELREIDTMARLDGATFALVLPGCALGQAVDVLDRVRAATPREQTASAGVARWDGDEPAELLEARCEDALAAAKAAGRDVTLAVE